MRDYKNSSFAAHGQPHNSAWILLSDLVRTVGWPLPYRSTIVCAIKPRPLFEAGDEDGSAQSIIGYLCVDANPINVFFEGTDVEVVQGVAEMLYPVIRLFKDGRRA